MYPAGYNIAVKMKGSRPYRLGLLKELKKTKFATAYLEAALEENDTKFLLKAIKNVVEANGGVAKLSEVTGLGRTSLYKTFSGNVAPHITTLDKILHALGLKLSFKPTGEKAPILTV
jgi:probable addiction module antidote protein